MEFKQMELKIKTQFSIYFPHNASSGCAIIYLIIIILDYKYFFFNAITFHRSSKTKFTLGKIFLYIKNTNGKKSHVSSQTACKIYMKTNEGVRSKRAFFMFRPSSQHQKAHQIPVSYSFL